MKRPKNGSTLQQFAYAQKILNADGGSKKQMALEVGYSPGMANNTKAKIEDSEGFKNAIIQLAHKSNNIILAAFAEYEARGFDTFSNKDLNGAMNALASAWDRIAKQRAPNKNETPEGNQLRSIFMKKVETKTTIEAVPVREATASEVDSSIGDVPNSEEGDNNPFDA